MDLKQIKKIIDLISDSEVDEVSIEEGDFKIKVKKTGSVQQVTYNQPAAPQHSAPPQPSSAAPQQPQETSSGETAAPQASGATIKSPIVGTYYESPSPEDPAFVKVGDNISKGQTLCIIEAMKIMNEIEAEFGGTLKEILVSDGTPVEFDQPLFIIEKD